MRATFSAVCVFVCAALVSGPLGCGTAHSPESSKAPAVGTIDAQSEAAGPEPPPEPPKELPGGGRTIFPEHRLVGYCGTPGAPALGELQGNLTKKAKALEARASAFAGNRKILLVFELIAVVVQGAPGPDGMYRRRVDDSVVDEYLRAARQFQALLLLNIQPGQSDFLTEVKTFERYLREPDVGVALDPEWAMKPKQQPGKFFGQTTGEALNQVADYLSGIVAANDLPEKVLVFHEVNLGVVKDEGSLTKHPGVVIVESVDGLGPVHAKELTYDCLMNHRPPAAHPGFKLFFDEDTRNGGRLMTAKEVLALSPKPEYIMYE